MEDGQVGNLISMPACSVKYGTEMNSVRLVKVVKRLCSVDKIFHPVIHQEIGEW